jgi:hypothetical protein
LDELAGLNLGMHRITAAKERLAVAEELYANNHYLDAASKAYYAIFQAARAALATLAVDSSKHSGVISLFNINYVKTGVFPKEYSKIIANAQDLRLSSDYDDFYVVSKKDAAQALDNALKFISGVETYLQDKIPSS